MIEVTRHHASPGSMPSSIRSRAVSIPFEERDCAWRRQPGDYLQSVAEVGSIVCHGPVDDPKGGWGLSIFSAKDQTEVERLTAADPIILDDVGARYEILPMKQLWIKGAN